MKARYFFIVATACAALSILGLRMNAQQSLDLRNKIVQNDLAGQSTEKDIAKLRQFVFSHMNSSADFELSGAYQRAVVDAQQDNVSDDLYRRAQSACDRQGVSSVDQAVCVQKYLQDRLDGDSEPVNTPLQSKYRYSFASPTWSPDLAGWSLLLSLLTLIIGTVAYVKNQFTYRLSGAE